ncbi:type VI secretion system baseplate subunit TssF [Pusillimonas sp. MFBS29]|uniref:type VI secretion system baseplate subunit TssF n=1 Tax=Pusillimonas sp. MFBS29 TaxID=2886690 RepID=UPI001D115A80|nr:type VI secretion system baseplate subunit TssF [Pusillimonas sp. MFBS29]MCC2596546.1 type VI secretion system baseplate subunit TssF [Pusillimonas sp. MFBS29]
MQPRLLDYYNRELEYLRELGAEFAERYPKVAGRLALNGTEVNDPYVERLLEGFSFLTARIQMKMDAEFPRFSQRLMDIVYPNYLAPVPSITVVQFSPSMNEGTLAKGFSMPRGTILRAGLAPGEQTRCEFSTAHEVTLWPMRVESAQLTGPPADLPLSRLGLAGRGSPVRAALRLRIALCGGALLHELDLDRLMFYLNGQDVQMSRLLELVVGHTVAVLCHDTSRPVSCMERLPRTAIRHEGFDTDQALLPADPRLFQGYRLLQEYFAFPDRYRFFSINGLKPALKRMGASLACKTFDLTILLDSSVPELENLITANHLALHCTPAINLVPKRADRLAVTARADEHHVVVERSCPLDYEVYSVNRVIGHVSSDQQHEFRPFYSSVEKDAGDYGAYFSVRREARLLSDAGRREGTRTAYTGSEVFLSLVDRNEAPHSDKLRHLSVETLCTNRDLPLLLPRGGASDFTLKISAPVSSVRILKGPSRPRPALTDSASTWRLISHMGLNYLSLVDVDEQQGAHALRELLSLYGDMSDTAVSRQISGLRHVRIESMYRHLPVPGPLLMGRGVKIDVSLDEAAFSGISPFMFAAVLEQFFARHVAINMMTETVLSTLQRGEVARWPVRMGGRPAV